MRSRTPHQPVNVAPTQAPSPLDKTSHSRERGFSAVFRKNLLRAEDSFLLVLQVLEIGREVHLLKLGGSAQLVLEILVQKFEEQLIWRETSKWRPNFNGLDVAFGDFNGLSPKLKGFVHMPDVINRFKDMWLDE